MVVFTSGFALDAPLQFQGSESARLQRQVAFLGLAPQRRARFSHSSGLIMLTLRKFLRFATPFLLTALLYKSQHFWGDWVRGEVRILEPYAFDWVYFGIDTPAGRVTPNEWWRTRTHWALDFVTGFFYIGFVAMYIGLAALQSVTRHADAGKARMARSLPWGFFWLNALGYITYYAWPAAPPWYVAQHGFGPPDFSVRANPAGAAAFDELLGTSVFQQMYGLSADVFGAVPSLHVAYPALALLVAWQVGRYRLVSGIYFAGMAFSAIYLNHHYVLDALWGVAYAAAIALFAQGMALGARASKR